MREQSSHVTECQPIAVPSIRDFPAICVTNSDNANTYHSLVYTLDFWTDCEDRETLIGDITANLT